MKREFGQLSHWWNGTFEQVKGYFCSRKYNGWSALWDGGVTKGMSTDKIPWYKKSHIQTSTGLWSLGRNNNPDVLYAPESFTNNLPKNVPVHGELWYNDRLDIIKQVCGQKKWPDPMWGNIKFTAFNIKPYCMWPYPFNDFNDDFNYTKSYNYLQNHIKSYPNDTLQLVVAIKINNEGDLKIMQETAIKHRWEGLIFANPNGKYECGRSYNSLKWKARCDNEAIIMNYEEGKTGKNIGKVGAITAHLEWDEQVLSLFGGMPHHIGREAIFSIGGLTDDEREWEVCKKKYPIGEKIKFTFFGVSIHGIPQSCNIDRS